MERILFGWYELISCWPFFFYAIMLPHQKKGVQMDSLVALTEQQEQYKAMDTCARELIASLAPKEEIDFLLYTRPDALPLAEALERLLGVGLLDLQKITRGRVRGKTGAVVQTTPQNSSELTQVIQMVRVYGGLIARLFVLEGAVTNKVFMVDTLKIGLVVASLTFAV